MRYLGSKFAGALDAFAEIVFVCLHPKILVRIPEYAADLPIVKDANGFCDMYTFLEKFVKKIYEIIWVPVTDTNGRFTKAGRPWQLAAIIK